MRKPLCLEGKLLPEALSHTGLSSSLFCLQNDLRKPKTWVPQDMKSNQEMHWSLCRKLTSLTVNFCARAPILLLLAVCNMSFFGRLLFSSSQLVRMLAELCSALNTLHTGINHQLDCFQDATLAFPKALGRRKNLWELGEGCPLCTLVIISFPSHPTLDGAL